MHLLDNIFLVKDEARSRQPVNHSIYYIDLLSDFHIQYRIEVLQSKLIILWSVFFVAEQKSRFTFHVLGQCHCWWTSEFPRAHVAKFYGRLRLIRIVLRASTFFVLKSSEIVILWVLYTIPLVSACGQSFSTFETTLFG